MTRAHIDKALAKLKKINPAHPMIPVIESCDLICLAYEYTKLALQDPIDIPAADISVNQMYQVKSNLYSRRAVLSNKFHTCTSDKERADVSRSIGSIQTEIIKNRRMIAEYHETGKIPKLREKIVIPLDGRAREKKLRSVRSSISYFKGLLRKELDPARIKKYENEIKRLADQSAELSA